MQEKMKTTPCNGEKWYAFSKAPRCGARTRGGTACQSPAVHNKRRCRMHGCGKGSGAPKGNAYALRHGLSATGVKAFKEMVRQIIRTSKVFKSK